MTRDEYVALRPGSIILHRRTGRYRLVIDGPRDNRSRRSKVPGGICLFKIGHSQYDPNPHATYFFNEIACAYDVTPHAIPEAGARRLAFWCCQCYREFGDGTRCRRPGEMFHEGKRESA